MLRLCPTRLPLVLGALALGAVTLGACGGHHSWHSNRLSLVSGKPELSDVDTGAPGPSVGDYVAFNAELLEGGQHVGWLYGTKTLVALPGERGASAESGRFLNVLTFDLADGTITVQGVQDTALVGDATHFKVGLSTEDERAITGGTGTYEGVSGYVKAETQADGSRVQVFHFG